MKFIIENEKRRHAAITYLKQIDITKAIECYIKPYKKNRTRSQNSLMWQYYAIIGDFMGMPSADLHELMKVRVLGVEEKYVSGELIRRPKSTTGLSTKEMVEFIIAIEMLAVELNLVLERPDDYGHAMNVNKGKII